MELSRWPADSYSTFEQPTEVERGLYELIGRQQQRARKVSHPQVEMNY